MKKFILIFSFLILQGALAKEVNLNTLINLGIKNNPSLKSKYYEYEKNKEFRKESFANFILPKFSVESKYSYQDEKSLSIKAYLPVLNLTSSNPDTGLRVPYQFSFTFVPSFMYSWNFMIKEAISPALYQAYKISKKAENLSYYNYLNERNKLTDKISKAYFNYQKTYYGYKVAQSYLNLTSKLYKDAKYLYEKGLITKKDLYQAKYYYQKSIEALVKALNYRKISKAYLKNLVNFKLDKIKIIDVNSLAGKISKIKLKDEKYYYNLARKYNPIFPLLKEKEKLSYEKYHLEISKTLPNVFAFGGYVITNQFASLGKVDYSTYGFGLSWEIGPNNIFSIVKEKKEILSTQYENQNIKNLISLDINQTLYNLKNNIYTIKAAQIKIKEAQEIYKMAKLKYKEGLATTKEVYDAIKDLNEAKNELASGVCDFLINYYHLNYLTGFKLKPLLK